MKILITGGAGYKGLVLARALLELDHDVTILDNFMYGIEPTLHLFSYPKVFFLKKDIRNITDSDLSSFDCIYHLAAISGYPACESNPHSAVMININATERILSYLSKNQLLIYASTTSIYGKADCECDEESPVKPASLYAKSKYEAEKLCMQRENTISLRFATLFGVAPRMRWDLLLNNFVMKAVQERSLVLFDADSTRTFIHVSDAIQAYLLALSKSDQMRDKIYNVGTEEMNFSKLQLAQKIQEWVKYEIILSKLEDLDMRNFIIKFDRLKALGFNPRLKINQGISELIKLFKYYNPVESFRFN